MIHLPGHFDLGGGNTLDAKMCKLLGLIIPRVVKRVGKELKLDERRRK